MKKENKFAKWYSQLSLPLKASFWFAISNILQKGMSMLTTPIFSRLMSEEQYGIYSTYVTWQSLLLIVVSLSLYKSLMNLFVKKEDHNRVLSSVIVLSLMITGTWLIIALALLFFLPSILKIPMPLVICLFVYMVFFPIIECWTVKKQFSFEYKPAILVALLSTVLSAGLGALSVLFISATAEARAVPQVVIVILVSVPLLIGIFRKNKGGLDKSVWAFSLSFCLPLLPHYLSEFVLSGSDKLMINYMCSAQDVAVYSIAYSVGSVINLFTGAINSTFAPYQYKMIKGEKFKRLSNTAGAVLIFVAFALFLIMLFGREIIIVFGSEKYLGAESCIVPICVGLFFNYLFQLFARVQEYFEHKLLVVVPSVLCAALNIGLNFVFIRLYGYIAASYTTAFCYFIFCFLHYLFYSWTCRKEIPGKQIYDIKIIAIVSFSFIAVSVGIYFIRGWLWAKLAFLGVVALLVIIFRKRLLALARSLFSKDEDSQSEEKTSTIEED